MSTSEEEKKNSTAFYSSSNLENLNKLCDFLRSSEGPAVREAVEMDKRVQYIKGEKLVNFMVEPKKGTKWPKNLPKIKSRNEALEICKELCKIEYIHRSEKISKGKLAISRNREFDESGYFTWIYQAHKAFSNMMTTLLIVGFFCCTCFPIWPNFLKVFVWYLSVTFLLFVFFLCTFRGLLFLVIWVIGYEFWFLPNLFDESLGFFDSFKPVVSFEKTKPGQLPYRVGIAIGFTSFCYWAITQPSEFDGFVAAQGDFIKDLYEGTLLSDMSQQDKEDIDKPKMPTLDDLLKMNPDEEEDEDDEIEEGDVDSLFDKLMDEEEDIDEDEE
eukprot:CAMPEP_0178962860 /NCGR_PEP_ID=MMETSP0789-20121207/14635_1 /TAXON_ID=3005 /ORGANISM="Rhizosolenia setigera, Strain CCMP 1694" /LENGTH=327 /DNA_ID=CAMNT_0020647129 /DNA_START=96 /DNA_END=1079 /DNA_ORIENTATION=-